MTKIAPWLVALLFVGGTASAEDKKLSESEVPRPVVAKVKKKYPTAKMTGFELENEDGKSSYEVKIVDGSRQLEVICAADGKIVAEEEKIAIEAVPAPVRKALESSAKYGSWTVRHAERVVLDEKIDAPSYEIKLTKGAAQAELLFTPDGKLTKTEESPAHEKKQQ